MSDITLSARIDTTSPKDRDYRSDQDAHAAAIADDAALQAALKNLDNKLHHIGKDSLQTGLSADIGFGDKAGIATYQLGKDYSYKTVIEQDYKGERENQLVVKTDDNHEYRVPVTHANIGKIVAALNKAASDPKSGVAAFAHIPNGQTVTDGQVMSGLNNVIDKELAQFKYQDKRDTLTKIFG